MFKKYICSIVGDSNIKFLTTRVNTKPYIEVIPFSFRISTDTVEYSQLVCIYKKTAFRHAGGVTTSRCASSAWHHTEHKTRSRLTVPIWELYMDHPCHHITISSQNVFGGEWPKT